MKIQLLLISFLIISFFIACSPDEEPILPPVVALDETPHEIDYGHFPEPSLPADNSLTKAGVQLGKMLFYETKLSRDNSKACANCHIQTNGFSDTLQFSRGVEESLGKRQSMSIFNMAWHSNGFFWDGRAELLRHQSLLPIQDELEMDETLDNVIAKLSAEQIYRDQFIRAFGSEEITSQKMSLAMEQFMLTIISNNSKYDQYLNGSASLTESEERGRQLYFLEYNPFFPDQSGADCEHCHGGINFENDQYMNNGLDEDVMMTDIGREEVSGNIEDKAKFKVPSLRNIALTAPYMHDGRFKTLEEVLNHYDHGIKKSSTLDPALLQVVDGGGLQLSDQNKTDLINFLKTLADETYLNNEAYSNPF